jgi:hypothetical protein
MKRPAPIKRQGYVSYGVARDVAPLFVCIPKWTRLNIFAERPGDRPCKPQAEHILAARHISQLSEGRTRPGSRWRHELPQAAA